MGLWNLTVAEVRKISAIMKSDGLKLPRMGTCVSLGGGDRICHDSASHLASGYYLLTDDGSDFDVAMAQARGGRGARFEERRRGRDGKIKLPKYDSRRGWVGGDSRRLYTYVVDDQRAGSTDVQIDVRPGGLTHGAYLGDPSVTTVRPATRAEAEAHWQSPLSSGWKVAGERRRRSNPGGKHLPDATAKQNRQYEHIKASALAQGYSLPDAKSIAAATVNKQKGRRRSRETSFNGKLVRFMPQNEAWARYAGWEGTIVSGPDEDGAFKIEWRNPSPGMPTRVGGQHLSTKIRRFSKRFSERRRRSREAAPGSNVTVDTFLAVLTSKLTQYDVRQSKTKFYNPNALGKYMEVVNDLRDAAMSSGILDRGDPEALDTLSRAIGKRLHLPPAANVQKQIATYLSTGKRPSLLKERR